MKKLIIIILILFVSLSLFGSYASLTKLEKSQIIWALEKAKIYNDLVKGDFKYIITATRIKSESTKNKLTTWYRVEYLQFPESNTNETITNILVVPVITTITKQNNFIKYLLSFIGGGIIGVLVAK